MPYIDQPSRQVLDGDIEPLIKALSNAGWRPGEVNYTFYRILLEWFKFEPRYKTICSIMGTLSCVGQEFYACVARIYENKAAWKNGNIAAAQEIDDELSKDWPKNQQKDLTTR